MSMDFRNVWSVFIISMFILIPLKILFVFGSWFFMSSLVFDIISMAVLVGIIGCVSFSTTRYKNIDVKKNYILSFLSILVAVGFFMCIPAYFNDTSNYDFAWQPLVMSLLSVLSFITFVILAITFFTGKNIINKLSFFLYCPVLWFALYMIIFMSIYTNDVNGYEVIAAALTSLFLVYYTQVFSTSSNLNIIKLMFIFGMPSVLFSVLNAISVIHKMRTNENISAVTQSTFYTQIFLSLFIIFVLIDAYRQYQQRNEPVIKSITI